MRSARRTTAIGAVLAALAAAAYWVWARPEERPLDDADGVAAGRVCRSRLPSGMELSCGTYGFGDLRYVCPHDAPRTGRCVRTSWVTVRNTGHAEVYVGTVSGPQQGVQEDGPRRPLAPGGEATVGPGARRLLFDITLRGTGGLPSRLEVVRVG